MLPHIVYPLAAVFCSLSSNHVIILPITAKNMSESLIFIWLSFCLAINGQDLSVYGLTSKKILNQATIPMKDKNAAYSKCLSGLGFTTCTPTLPTTQQEMSYVLDFYTQVTGTTGQNYCVACCGTPPSNIDYWDLTCPINFAEMNRVNFYGHEVRMARNKNSKDTELTICPIKRSACDYSSDGTLIGCPREIGDNTHIIGMKVTLNVRRYNGGFKYWNGVSSCEVEIQEISVPLRANQTYIFKESYVLNHQPVPFLEQPFDMFKLLIIVLVILFVILILLYFCRRKHCVYCQKKLVFSFTLCIYCRMVGVEMPDPVLMKALEEKSNRLQGTIPERFPGARACTTCFRGCWRYFCRCGRSGEYTVAKILPTTDELIENGKVQSSFDKGDEESKDGAMSELTSITSKTKNKKQPRSVLKASAASTTNTTTTGTVATPAVPETNKKGKKEKPRNPNILDYPDPIIYRAVQHPDFMVLEDTRAKKKVFVKSFDSEDEYDS